MTHAGIGRALVASLHQGISDLLPTRLEFYESWLNPAEIHHRRRNIGLAPWQAALSFLRLEGDAYGAVTRRAGAYAAEWTVASQWPATRAVIRRLPPTLRARAALGFARRTMRRASTGTRAKVRLRRGKGTIDVHGSLFCVSRVTAAAPLCGFYEAVAARFLELYRVDAEVRCASCRAAGDPSCVLELALTAGGRPREATGTP